jgi:zinc protease
MSRAGKTEITRHRLRNGLEIRLKPIHTAPLVTSWMWYRVGSRNEQTGQTGVSHWVEHMQFKGTPDFPGGKLDKAISRDGGAWNAFTTIDWTTYFEVMPADRIDLALRLEADRMVNSNFDPAEVESERTVIISERQSGENDPAYRLSEEVQAAAFRVHAYHHEVIGDMTDLETMTRDDLYGHYRAYYAPSNAVLALAGDFHPTPMLKRIRELFGGLPKVPQPVPRIRKEPPQEGERRVVVEGPDPTPIVEVAYKAPAASDPDFVPLAVLDSVLVGASGLSPFGGGLPNKTSRLYRALVQGGLAAAVSGGLAATIDPYLYSIRITVRPDRSPDAALERLDEEVDRLLQSAVTKEEVLKAIKQAKAIFAYDSESITRQGMWLGYSEMFADYSWFETFLGRIGRVTPEEVLRVAHKYLRPSTRVVGIFRPVKEVPRGHN